MPSRKYPKGASTKVLARNRTQRSCVGIARRRVIELPIVARSKETTTVESRKVPRKATSKGRATRKSSKANATSVARQVTCQRIADFLKRVRSKLATSWQRRDASKWQTYDLNALEIGAVHLLEKGHRMRIGIDSCAAVTVFPKSVADDYPLLDMPGKANSYRPASGKLLPDLGARRVQVKLRDGSLGYVNPRVADTHRALMAVSEMNDMGPDVFFPRSDRCIKAYAYHESSGTKLELERVN